MLTPLTERQKTLIVNNIVNACKDITKLNKTGYKFISLASGFIAHYNIEGFKSCYNTYRYLSKDILSFTHQNQWNNFRPSDQNYEYYMSRKDVYIRIADKIKINLEV